MITRALVSRPVLDCSIDLDSSIKDHEEEIFQACTLDLHKPHFETQISEYGWLLNDIVFVTRNLHKWLKDEKASDIDLTFKLMNPKIRKDPLGCVLVIGCVVCHPGAIISKLIAGLSFAEHSISPSH